MKSDWFLEYVTSFSPPKLYNLEEYRKVNTKAGKAFDVKIK
jgi:hypothetical protein